jgi:hypothetical protein
MGFYCIELMAAPQEVAFVVGGRASDIDDVTLALVERYDVTSGAWSEVASMSTARYLFGLCELDGELYLTGGLTAGEGALASVERYDPILDTWSAALAMPHPRYAYCACAVGDVMYVLGGVEVVDGQDITESRVLKFNSRTQTWSEMAPMPAERDHAAACVVGSDIFIFGGYDDDEKATFTTYCYSTETKTWVTLAPMPEANHGHSVYVLDGLTYVIGGERIDDNRSLSSVHRFDPVANSWIEVAPMSVARYSFGAFLLDGSIYAVGGRDGDSRLTSMERYCVASDSWSEVSNGMLDQARSALRTIVMRLKVDFFDSLMVQAKRARR